MFFARHQGSPLKSGLPFFLIFKNASGILAASPEIKNHFTIRQSVLHLPHIS